MLFGGGHPPALRGTLMPAGVPGVVPGDAWELSGEGRMGLPPPQLVARPAPWLH